MVTKEEVVRILKTHLDTLRKISLLEFEIQYPARITANDMITSLTFAHNNSEIRSTGQIANKTPYIAECYQEAAEKANNEVVFDLTSRLFALKKRTEHLTYYLSLLSEKEQSVTQHFYFDHMTLQEISDLLRTSVWSVRKLREQAIEHLTSMYNFVEDSTTPNE